MKRWLSLVKRHVMPGNWTQPAKKRRPLTVMTQTDVFTETRPLSVHRPREVTPPADIFYTAPLVPIRAPQPMHPPLCDVDLIMRRYDAWSPSLRNLTPIPRPDSQALPIDDLLIPPSAFVDYAFIHFEPTYKVTINEVSPYRLELRKPRVERFSRRIVSFFQGETHGQVRFSAAVHPPQ